MGDARSIARADGGEPSQAILAEAKRGYDLLVLGATTRGTNGDGPLFEHFVDDVIQESPCPLLVVTSPGTTTPGHRRTHCRQPHSRPHVGHPGRPVRSRGGLRHGAQGGAEIDLVHVVSRAQHELRMGGDEAISHAVKIGEDIVAKTGELGEAMGVTVNTDVLVADHPEQAIVERAEQGPTSS